MTMETHLTEAIRNTPEGQEAEKILRRCVHCGFCTATCPTYQLLGDELDSPRGRIYLIKDMLENGRPADAKTVKHIDRCLSCLACMTTCPSGVHYMHLVDHAREYIEKTYTTKQMIAKLRRLADCLEQGKRFQIQIQGERILVPSDALFNIEHERGKKTEEVEFQFKWTL